MPGHGKRISQVAAANLRRIPSDSLSGRRRHSRCSSGTVAVPRLHHSVMICSYQMAMEWRSQPGQSAGAAAGPSLAGPRARPSAASRTNRIARRSTAAWNDRARPARAERTFIQNVRRGGARQILNQPQRHGIWPAVPLTAQQAGLIETFARGIFQTPQKRIARRRALRFKPQNGGLGQRRVAPAPLRRSSSCRCPARTTTAGVLRACGNRVSCTQRAAMSGSSLHLSDGPSSAAVRSARGSGRRRRSARPGAPAMPWRVRSPTAWSGRRRPPGPTRRNSAKQPRLPALR